MQHIKDLFGDERILVKKRRTERGDLLEYFALKTKRNIKYIAFRCTALSVKDLYYIKSACDDYERNGNPWSKGFFGMLKS